METDLIFFSLVFFLVFLSVADNLIKDCSARSPDGFQPEKRHSWMKSWKIPLRLPQFLGLSNLLLVETATGGVLSC